MVSMPKKALLTIQSGISQIRYATLKGIMAAKKKEIREIVASTDGLKPSHQRIQRIYLPEKTKQTQSLAMAMQKEERRFLPRSSKLSQSLLSRRATRFSECFDWSNMSNGILVFA